MKQDELGHLLRQMVPPVDETGVWESIEQRAGCEQTNAESPVPASGGRLVARNAKPARPKRIPRTRRSVGLAAVTVIVLVAVGFGANALIEQMTEDHSVVVINDDSMSPGDTSDNRPGAGSIPVDTLPPVQTGDPASHRWASVQLTDNELMDEVPYLQGSLLVWRAHDGHDFEIKVYDFETGATTQLTDNEVDDWEPKVYGSRVAWMEGPAGGPWALRLHDRATGITEKIPEGAVLYGQYQLKGDLLVWARAGEDAAQVKIIRLSTGETQTLGGWEARAWDVKVRTDGRYVLVAIAEPEGEAQEHSPELRLFDTESGDWRTIASGAITDDWRYLDDRRLADGAVVWSASDGHDEEIFLYDIASGTTTQLTHNEESDTEPEVGRGYVLWARTESLQASGTGPTDPDREVILYERASSRERSLGRGFGRLSEDGSLALWSEWPQKAENLWFYDIERDQAAYLGTPGFGASWPDAVGGFVVWYSERLGAKEPTAEIMVATVAPPSTAADEATAQAEAALEEFFQAWAAKDGAAMEALLTEYRRQYSNYGNPTFFEALDRIEFGTVVAAPEGIDSYVTYGGRGARDDIAREDVRCFRASVTSYFKPGFVGVNDSGEELPCLWWLVRGADGKWRVDSWGA